LAVAGNANGVVLLFCAKRTVFVVVYTVLIVAPGNAPNSPLLLKIISELFPGAAKFMLGVI
jgi:hypothetical protein